MTFAEESGNTRGLASEIEKKLLNNTECAIINGSVQPFFIEHHAIGRTVAYCHSLCLALWLKALNYVNYLQTSTRLVQLKYLFQMNPLFHSEADGSCEYLARWKYDENLDKIDFVIKSTNVGKWTGIGFSETPQMVKFTFQSTYTLRKRKERLIKRECERRAL